jgi:hypothetical protein
MMFSSFRDLIQLLFNTENKINVHVSSATLSWCLIGLFVGVP